MLGVIFFQSEALGGEELVPVHHVAFLMFYRLQMYHYFPTEKMLPFILTLCRAGRLRFAFFVRRCGAPAVFEAETAYLSVG